MTYMPGTREKWLAARLRLLEEEKELTRRSEELARRRQQLPWVRIDKEYVFDTDAGEQSAAWSVCRDVTMPCVFRAPLAQLDAYKRRMGLTVRWVSSLRSDFNYDFGVSLRPGADRDEAVFDFDTTWGRYGNTEEHEGLSAFAPENGIVHRTYSCHLRGREEFNVAYQLLDRVPRGRDEGKLPYPQAWIHRRDEYGAAGRNR